MRLRSFTFALLCFSLVRLTAQDAQMAGPPDELVQLRRQFETQGLSKAKLLSEQFANALANIAREAGAEGDYEQALAAQRRRAQIISLYGSSTDDTALANVILLKPGDARVNGAVNFDRNLNALVSWKTAGSVASWDVTRMTPGAYEVTITYAAAEMGDAGRVNPFVAPPDLSTGGDFEFYEDSSLPGAEQNRRTGTIASTGGWTEWQTLTLPAIQITRTSARFCLRITKARGTGGVMNLKGIRLAPPSPVATGTDASPDGTSPPQDELASLRQLHEDNLRRVLTPVVNSYSEKMTAMAATITASDADTAGEYTAEARRAAELLEDPLAAVSGNGKGTRKGPGNAGFRELRDIAYVKDPANTADRFKVKQGDEEFFVRLLWVRCPPADGKDEKRTRECAEYFDISMEDAQEVGREAQEFTTGYLSGKSLTLLTRGTKDEGDLLVAVRPGAFGDFAGVLVDHGLAMIKPASKKGPAPQHDEAALRNLAEREAAAKGRAIPAGAWARSTAR